MEGTPSKRVSTIVILSYSRAASFLLRMAIPPFIPFFMSQMHWNSLEVGGLASAYLWSYAVTQLLWGPLVDRWGGKRTILLSWSIVFLSSIAFALGSDLQQLIVARIFFGAGASAIFIASVVMITEVYHQHERGVALGAISSASSLGVLLAGLLIPWLLTTGIAVPPLAGWRTVWIIITIPALVALLLSLRLPSRVRARSVSQQETAGGPKSTSKLVSDPRLYMLSVSVIGYLVGYTTVSTWVYLFLFQEYHLSLPLAGAIASIGIFVPGMVGPFLSGWLSDRFHTRTGVSIMGAVPLAFVMLLLFTEPSLPVVVVLLVLFGLFALFHTPIFSLPAELWSVDVSGRVLGIVSAMAQVGAAATPAVTGYLLSRNPNFGELWLFGAGAYAMATVALLMLGRARPPAIRSARG